MFEHSLYDPEPIAEPLREGDLFHDYEIKNWEFSPRIYKIMALAGAANLFGLLVFAQTSLLTMKGCDSPLVARVCQALDVIYVGSALFGTDREYIDAVYDKTELGDSDITFVDVSGVTPPLSYPEGYFQVANPLGYQAMLDAQNNSTFPSEFSGFPSDFPVTTPSTGSSIIDTAPDLPKPNSNVIQGDLPTFGGGLTYTPPSTRKNRRGGRPAPPAVDDSVDDLAQDTKPSPTPAVLPTPMTSDAINAVEINKKPLTDFADGVATKWESKEIDLNQSFTLVLNGVITKEGKLDRTKSKFDAAKQKGDQKMIDIAKGALVALGDSGYLTYLQVQGIEKITAIVTQDEQQINVVISSPQKTVERANTLSSIISAVIVAGKIKVENPSDERTLLDGAKTGANGKDFVLHFVIPKPIAQEMITRKLKEAQAKKLQQPPPNGNSNTKIGENTGRNK